jgi:hypothetical protein
METRCMTVASDPSPAPPALPEALRHVPAMLSAEFPERVSVDDVQRTVAATYDELAASARIASFLPILTEKVARDRLARVVGHRGHRTSTAA